jgi:hypothetical protein
MHSASFNQPGSPLFPMTLQPPSFLKSLIALTCAIGCTSILHAATITWGAAANTTGKSNLIEGNVVHAWSGGTAATITNGGISGTSTYTFSGVTYGDFTFSPAAVGSPYPDSSGGTASTGDSNMDTMLKSLTYTTNGITSGTQTIGGLTNGTTSQPSHSSRFS